MQGADKGQNDGHPGGIAEPSQMAMLVAQSEQKLVGIFFSESIGGSEAGSPLTPKYLTKSPRGRIFQVQDAADEVCGGGRLRHGPRFEMKP